MVALRLDQSQPDGLSRWIAEDVPHELTITTGEAGRIVKIEKSQDIGSTAGEIGEVFIQTLAERSIQEAAGIEVTEEFEDDSPEPFPYDPEFIRVDTKPFNISLVYDMIKDGDINLSPDFQRQFVWTDIGARSRLIESIMLRIPLPVFYLAQDHAGRLQVVDGLQRLTVIKQFLDNELRLRDLEYLKEEEGKVFRHDDPSRCIDQRFRKRIMQTQIMMNIIDPQTPADVKFDIFKRINQGGRPLNAQEIRNCMSSPETRHLLHSLSRSPDFLEATCSSVGTVRMQDQEIALRFVAFRLADLKRQAPYLGNMERFLDQTIETINRDPRLFDQLVPAFERSMRNSAHLFGAFAFRKCSPQDLLPGARRRLMNNSLFTTWSVVLAERDEEDVRTVEAESFAGLIAHELDSDADYYDSVSFGTNDRRRLRYAFEKARALCAEHIG
ncbi:GmrSD restriction endonuclease domain-containing protein [Sphingobium lactosutens]|uniref:GmrSD restriction endonucleases N-terminal domain-containing protein n=1 Tax=Sphingobium lactosutens DS20 TaxID=1331060 RepID=T0J3V4_9SPHN|nr:DUF262 domain-containing protein [Sphingobium lactosutens]EQB16669.1 hypothetical protein RLDS_07590 [Sphingobium lactosutens DS20]